MSKNGKDEEFEELDFLDDELFSELDDDRRSELEEMLGLKVLGVEMYEESIGDDEEEGQIASADRVFFDCDLYLEDNQALELYVATAYPDPDTEPAVGIDNIFEAVGRLADNQLALLDYGEADEEGGLALAFGRNEKVEMVLVCSAWMVSEWEPEESDSDDE